MVVAVGFLLVLQSLALMLKMEMMNKTLIGHLIPHTRNDRSPDEALNLVRHHQSISSLSFIDVQAICYSFLSAIRGLLHLRLLMVLVTEP